MLLMDTLLWSIVYNRVSGISNDNNAERKIIEGQYKNYIYPIKRPVSLLSFL